MYLSRFGHDVCIMDFDLEAPGLHYKFPEFIEKTDINRGLIDYIYEFTNNNMIPPSLKDFTFKFNPISKYQKGIRLFPAGNIFSPDYWQKLASINWHRLFYERESEGIPFFIELKERIEKELNPDFLLIDSRTGITEMSGLCTSIFPDTVVYLLVNNRENVEGASQILQSIQKVERLPGQKPVKVMLALTRIPLPENENDKKFEAEIVNRILDSLNIPAKILDEQINIQDVCILHSDRELELSESLSINREKIGNETPLSRDYLKLFSKIIPSELILPKLDNIIDEITNTKNLFEDPDLAQNELEGVVASYPNPRSLEKLINFYILRGKETRGIIDKFNELWNGFGIEDHKLLTKYVSYFINDSSRWDRPKFKGAIIEHYLKSNPDNRILITIKLGDWYNECNESENALKCYFEILNEINDKKEILEKIIDVLLNNENYEGLLELFNEYSDIIDQNMSLRIKKIEVFFNMRNKEYIQILFNQDNEIEEALANFDVNLYLNVVDFIGISENADKYLETLLIKKLKTSRISEKLELGKLFYKHGKFDLFDDIITTDDDPSAEKIIIELKKKFKRKFD